MLLLIMFVVCCLPLLLGLVLWLVAFKYSHLPNDLGSPLFGNLQKVVQSLARTNIDDLFNWISERLSALGDTVVLWQGPLPMVVTADPLLVQTMLFLILFVVCCLPLLFGLVLWLVAFKYSHLPNDLGSPLFGNLQKVIQSLARTNIDDLFNWMWERLSALGDTVVLWQGPLPMVVTADPLLVEKLFNNPAVKDKEHFVYGAFRVDMCGVVSHCPSDGFWRHQRRMLVKSMTLAKLRSHHEAFVRRSQKLIETLNKQKGEFDISSYLVLCSVDIILDTHFGIELKLQESLDIELSADLGKGPQKIADRIANPFLRLIPTNLIPSAMTQKAKKFHANCVQGLMENLENYSEDEDIPHAQEILRDGLRNKISIKTIDKILRDLIYEGAYIVARVASFVAVFLAAYPEVQQKAWEEQETLMKRAEEKLTFEDINKMEYLERVILETTRLVSPPLIARRLTEELTVGNVKIPKNTSLLIFGLYMRTNPKFWETPNGFNPDHFLPERTKKIPKVMSSFGIAPRNCPGGRFAINQIKVIISSVIRRYELRSSLGPQDIQYSWGIFMDLKGGYPISLKQRTLHFSD